MEARMALHSAQMVAPMLLLTRRNATSTMRQISQPSAHLVATSSMKEIGLVAAHQDRTVPLKACDRPNAQSVHSTTPLAWLMKPPALIAQLGTTAERIPAFWMRLYKPRCCARQVIFAREGASREWKIRAQLARLIGMEAFKTRQDARRAQWARIVQAQEH
jgi:hypothetical protein